MAVATASDGLIAQAQSHVIDQLVEFAGWHRHVVLVNVAVATQCLGDPLSQGP